MNDSSFNISLFLLLFRKFELISQTIWRLWESEREQRTRRTTSFKIAVSQRLAFLHQQTWFLSSLKHYLDLLTQQFLPSHFRDLRENRDYLSPSRSFIKISWADGAWLTGLKRKRKKKDSRRPNLGSDSNYSVNELRMSSCCWFWRSTHHLCHRESRCGWTGGNSEGKVGARGKCLPRWWRLCDSRWPEGFYDPAARNVNRSGNRFTGCLLLSRSSHLSLRRTEENCRRHLKYRSPVVTQGTQSTYHYSVYLHYVW